jgi:hypothetical protein
MSPAMIQPQLLRRMMNPPFGFAALSFQETPLLDTAATQKVPEEMQLAQTFRRNSGRISHREM